MKCLYFLLIIFSAMDISNSYAGKISSYSAVATLQNGDFFPVVISSSSTNKNINWQSLKSIQTTGINWQALPQITQSYNINWTDIKTQQTSQGLTSGINWNYLDTSNGGINWTLVTKSASDNTILCAKGGQIGKCAASFSATNAGSCTCI